LAFHAAVSVGSIIITKLDGHAKGGGALSAVAATGSPIWCLGQGEHFEDLELFHAPSFVSKLLGYGDARGLAEAVKGASDKDMMEKMSKGEFTLRDMYKYVMSWNLLCVCVCWSSGSVSDLALLFVVARSVRLIIIQTVR
jgi:signal recognition particle subunit SRP54